MAAGGAAGQWRAAAAATPPLSRSLSAGRRILLADTREVETYRAANHALADRIAARLHALGAEEAARVASLNT